MFRIFFSFFFFVISDRKKGKQKTSKTDKRDEIFLGNEYVVQHFFFGKSLSKAESNVVAKIHLYQLPYS